MHRFLPLRCTCIKLGGGDEDNRQPQRPEATMGWLIGGAIVSVTFLFSRRAGAVVVAFLAVAWVGFWLATDRKSEQEPSNRSVSIEANSDPQLCPNPDKPVSVRIANHADRALETVSFSLVAKQRNSIVYRASHRSDEARRAGRNLLAVL